jgi:Putative auto-transporter adhesin, head GIN domain
MRIVVILISCGIFILFNSCKKATIKDAFKRTGTVTEELRTFASPIHIVSVHDAINLTTVADSINYVVITAGKNLLPKITTELVAGELTIQNINSFNWTRSYSTPINVVLHTNSISYLKVMGTGTIILNENTYTTDTLKLRGDLTSSEVNLYCSPKVMVLDIATGTGTYILHGSCNSLFAYTGAIGKIDASDFKSGYTDFTNSGLSDIYLNTQGGIYGQIYSLGDVYDKGTGTLLYLNKADRGNYIKQ